MRRSDPFKYQEKRQEILAAASRCFLRDGLRGASISTICAEAGISPGHLYHYFDGKDAIVEAMAREYLANFQAHFSELTGQATVISSVIAEIERVAIVSPGRHLMLFELVAEANRNPRIAKVVHDNSKAMRSLLAAFIRKGQERGEVDTGLDCDTAAAVVLGLIDTPKIMRARHADIGLKNYLNMLSTVVESFLSGKSRSPVRRAGSSGGRSRRARPGK